MGSYHGLELSYLWRVTFPNSYPPLSPAQERLSTTMIAYWSAFIHTGNPNGDDRPHWPRFDDTDSMLTLGSSPARDHRCDFWAGLPR
jgi:para-nitrobenzyl esterase